MEETSGETLGPGTGTKDWEQGPGDRIRDLRLGLDQGRRTKDQEPGTRAQGPRTRDEGPRTKDQEPGSNHQGTLQRRIGMDAKPGGQDRGRDAKRGGRDRGRRGGAARIGGAFGRTFADVVVVGGLGRQHVGVVLERLAGCQYPMPSLTRPQQPWWRSWECHASLRRSVAVRPAFGSNST